MEFICYGREIINYITGWKTQALYNNQFDKLIIRQICFKTIVFYVVVTGDWLYPDVISTQNQVFVKLTFDLGFRPEVHASFVQVSSGMVYIRDAPFDFRDGGGESEIFEK